MAAMRFQTLWYVRRGTAVSGPFPEKWIRRDLALGRLQPDDEISPDRLSWIPLRERPDWLAEPAAEAAAPDLPGWREERRRARRRWLDERRLPDRRKAAAPRLSAAAEQRRQPDRRAPESAEILLLRQRHADLEMARGVRRERFLGVAIGLLLLLILTVWAGSHLAPVNPVPVRLAAARADCRAPASPQVDWSRCDKAGAWLRGVDLSSAVLVETRFSGAHLGLARLSYANLARADLSHADLAGAVLAAANLQGADLSYAILKGADLRRADLRAARLDAADLTGAQLASALWTDGRECPAGAVGLCR